MVCSAMMIISDGFYKNMNFGRKNGIFPNRIRENTSLGVNVSPSPLIIAHHAISPIDPWIYRSARSCMAAMVKISSSRAAARACWYPES